MIELEHAEITWDLTGYCKFQCSYCPAQSKTGQLDKTVDQYLSVVDKLQQTRYKHHNKIYWKLGGGEPLHFPHLGTLLKKIREKPSTVELVTSGDDSWFSLYGVLELVDRVKLTYHAWQNDDMFDFILEKCKEKNVEVSILVPLLPGRIIESKERIQRLIDQGHECSMQVLKDPSGDFHREYSIVDINRILGRPDDYVPAPVILDPNKPHPQYIDLRVVSDNSLVYTGMPCYAGVDWIYINPKGFASYSQCGGRSEHFNVFDPQWQPPDNAFACTLNQCRHEQDRQKIRIIKS